ncbi:MAG TPA: hypothetical protein VHE10_02785 [Candidatus Paceibacterota bacterium]|nr:hypothetical protein [Candidatus Paceibacterota bacterium]
MNDQEYKLTDAMIEALPEEPMPAHLHGRIMKRVFLAGYGKYLAFSTAVLCLNLSVLSVDIYRALSNASAEAALKTLRNTFAMTPAYFASALETFWTILPLQSIAATFFTIAVSAYITVVFVRVYRNPHGVKILKM